MLTRLNRCPRTASGRGARRCYRRASAFVPGKWEYAPLATQIGKDLQEQLLAASPSFPDSLSDAMYRPADTSLSEESEGDDEQVPFMEARVLLSSDLALLHIIHGLKQRGIILTPTIAGRVIPPDTELEPLHRPLREARLLQDATDWVDLFVASLLEISASGGAAGAGSSSQHGKKPVVHEISKYHLAFTYALNISYGWNLEGLAQRFRLDGLLSGFSGVATALGSDGHPDADGDAGGSNRSASSDGAGQGEATASPELAFQWVQPQGQDSSGMAAADGLPKAEREGTAESEEANMARYKQEVSELQPSLTSLSCTGSLPAIRSVERHCTAVFGDMDVLTERWRRYAAKAMTESGTATEQAKTEMQEGIISGSLECVELTEQALRRVLFEAVCFGMELHIADNRLSACGQVGVRDDRAWDWAKRLFG